MAVVVNLDAVERRREPEGGGDAVEQLALRSAFGEPAPERLARAGGDAVDQLLLVAAPRYRERHVPAAERQRFLDQILLDQRMAEQHQWRFRPVVVELADKGGQHLLYRELAVVAREIGAVAPVLAAAEE